MSDSQVPLIIGAGPVGLAASVYLAKQGVIPRLIEMRPEPSHYSKALAVNARTLEIMESVGITAKMIARGIRINGAQMHDGERILMEVTFEKLRAKFPFLLALSQASTEQLLAEEFQQMGGRVERNLKLTNCKGDPTGVDATLESADGTAKETLRTPWLLGCDGARSTVREQLAINFPGHTLPNEWYLQDVPLKTTFPQDRAHIFFLKEGGGIFLVRVVNDVREEQGPVQLWRVMGTVPDAFSRVPQIEKVGEPTWQSKFSIAHRIADRLQGDNIYLAGDAAHLHSPIGGRGMNLGIEDAWFFSELFRRNQLTKYSDLRRPVDQKIVRKVESFTRLAMGTSLVTRLFRTTILPLLMKLPPTRGQMMGTVTGLDHALPAFS